MFTTILATLSTTTSLAQVRRVQKTLSNFTKPLWEMFSYLKHSGTLPTFFMHISVQIILLRVLKFLVAVAVSILHCLKQFSCLNPEIYFRILFIYIFFLEYQFWCVLYYLAYCQRKNSLITSCPLSIFVYFLLSHLHQITFPHYLAKFDFSQH